ncbi:MAG: hypothetical protein P8J59_12195 [Phycisphaerales bacterium]|nr:hypothetical protein [Phycisphaerales bacterium]
MPSMILIAFSLVVFAATAFGQSSPSEKTPATSDVVQEQDQPSADEERPDLSDRMHRGGRRSEGGERLGGRGGFMIGGGRNRENGRGGMGRRPITEADIETMIEIADSISPKWASELRTMMAGDPEKARQIMIKSGRRLFGLVMLKEKKPELFETRVEELRVQFEIRATYASYQEALKAGDEPAISTFGSSLKSLASKIVDLELKARAMELAALDQAVQEMRLKLQQEIKESAERITGMIEGLLKPEPEQPEQLDSESNGPSGARSSRSGVKDASATSG